MPEHAPAVEPLPLREIQRRVLAVVTATEPADAAYASAAPFVRATGPRSAGRRLDTYRRSHHHRLHGALRALFPGMRQLLGDELFDAFATDFLATQPSHSHSLVALGPQFCRHLDVTRNELDDAAWTQPIVDLARLEVLFREVYDGAEQSPRTGLFRAGHLVGDYLAAVHAGRLPEPLSAGDCRLLVHRRDFRVLLTPLAPAEYELLSTSDTERHAADPVVVPATPSRRRKAAP